MEANDLVKVKQDELAMRRDELDQRKAEATLEFAKFGFRGTLAAAIVGMVCFVILVAIQQFGKTPSDNTHLVVFTLALLIGCLAFGYFSLNKLPVIAAEIMGYKIKVGEVESDAKVMQRTQISEEGAGGEGNGT